MTLGRVLLAERANVTGCECGICLDLTYKEALLADRFFPSSWYCILSLNIIAVHSTTTTFLPLALRTRDPGKQCVDVLHLVHGHSLNSSLGENSTLFSPLHLTLHQYLVLFSPRESFNKEMLGKWQMNYLHIFCSFKATACTHNSLSFMIYTIFISLWMVSDGKWIKLKHCSSDLKTFYFEENCT